MTAMSGWARSDAFKVLKSHPLAAALDWDGLAKSFQFDLAVIDDPEGTIPVATLYGVFEQAAKTLGNDAIMFDIFNTSEVGSFTLFDYLFVCAPTLRDACLAWQRYIPMRTNTYQLRYHESPDYGSIEWTVGEGCGHWHQNMFARFGWSIRRFEIALETNEPPLIAELATPKPRGHSDFLQRYGDKIRFNRVRNTISVPAALLSKPLKQNEDSLYAIIQKSALQQLAALENLDSPVARIADEVAEALKTGTCNLANIAQKLGMSQRSMQRLLEQEGTSFRKLTEDVRKSAAERYLHETALPFKEIAFLLGFSDLSTFSRAVKLWFGVPPRKYRESKFS